METDSSAHSIEDKAMPSQHAVLDVPEVKWWKSPGLRTLYMMMPILFLGSTVNGYDGSLLNGLQTSKQWQTYFNNPDGSELGLITAIQNIGAVCALPFSAYAADLFGRKIGIATGLVFIFIGTILQIAPCGPWHVYRRTFLVGFGSNISQGSAPLLIMEVRPLPSRDLIRQHAHSGHSLPTRNTEESLQQCTTLFGMLGR